MDIAFKDLNSFAVYQIRNRADQFILVTAIGADSGRRVEQKIFKKCRPTVSGGPYNGVGGHDLGEEAAEEENVLDLTATNISEINLLKGIYSLDGFRRSCGVTGEPGYFTETRPSIPLLLHIRRPSIVSLSFQRLHLEGASNFKKSYSRPIQPRSDRLE